MGISDSQIEQGKARYIDALDSMIYSFDPENQYGDYIHIENDKNLTQDERDAMIAKEIDYHHLRRLNGRMLFAKFFDSLYI